MSSFRNFLFFVFIAYCFTNKVILCSSRMITVPSNNEFNVTKKPAILHEILNSEPCNLLGGTLYTWPLVESISFTLDKDTYVSRLMVMFVWSTSHVWESNIFRNSTRALITLIPHPYDEGRGISETSTSTYQATRCYIPKDSHFLKLFLYSKGEYFPRFQAELHL